MQFMYAFIYAINPIPVYSTTSLYVPIMITCLDCQYHWYHVKTYSLYSYVWVIRAFTHDRYEGVKIWGRNAIYMCTIQWEKRGNKNKAKINENNIQITIVTITLWQSIYLHPHSRYYPIHICGRAFTSSRNVNSWRKCLWLLKNCFMRLCMVIICVLNIWLSVLMNNQYAYRQ